MSPIARARHIARTLGVFRAARFLAARGFSLEFALFVLLRAPAR